MNQRLRAVFVVLIASALLTGTAIAAASPSVKTGRASSIKTSSADLHGTVNPNGKTAHFLFELGLTKGYGVVIGSKRAIRGSARVAVKVTARHLLPGTVYHYRLAASNGAGTSFGHDRTFKTAGHPPPGAATGPATDITTSRAILTGLINPHGQQTQYVFQYGVSKSYSAQTLVRSAGGGKKVVVVAYQLSGLAPRTLYHYRLVALHGLSVVSYGADETFFTRPVKRPKPRLRARIKPHRSLFAPFAFTTSGRLMAPNSIPRPAGCSGTVVERFFLGRRVVRKTSTSVNQDCTFSAKTVFNRIPRHSGPNPVRLRVVIRFRGNGYLKPAKAPQKHILLG
ncbi:MAG: hypothetical protein JOZ73_13275 [Solirubrobacterales bacterium]|nr:hypothetical protein [Solirubrobacterales bacterium]